MNLVFGREVALLGFWEYMFRIHVTVWLKYYPFPVLINCYKTLGHSPKILNAAKVQPESKIFLNPFSVYWIQLYGQKNHLTLLSLSLLL
jgi:hypothetical protein